MSNNLSTGDTKPDPLLIVEHLTKRVQSPSGQLQLLDDIYFNIFPSESVAILGASGAGKSTLLGILAGLDVPTSGRVMLDKQDIFCLDEDGRAQLRGRFIGFVFQSFQLLPSLTALENVMLPLELLGLALPETSARQVLSRVGLSKRTAHYPRQLSGGEQQRVAIARAFAVQPKILLADEPTGNLDTKNGERIIELLFELNTEQKTTLILVTHDRELAKRCDRELVLDAGRMMEMRNE
ncbi:MAG TPA: ABC transporter ATP-binding protein [Gammaproteobacteria bacterium]|nr:ABC transporter ATP-binding protein [Gammaproteobacteria bacterium]